MELVFKKDCFLNKLFACIFIAMFILMCILGAEVSATDNENNELVVNGITFVLPEYDKNTYKYSIIFKTAQNDADKDWYCFAYSDKPFFASSYDFTTGDPNSPYRIVSGQINPYSSTGLVNFTSNCYFTSVYPNSSNICDYSSRSFQNNSVTNFLDYVVYSSDTIYLLNKNDNQYFADTSTSVFPLPTQESEERGANGDVDYDSYINGLIGSNGGNLGNIANDIASGDIGSSVENSDKTSIFNISQKLGGGFSKVFGFFNFVDTVKNSIVDIYNLLINTTEAPKLYMSFNHQYLQGEHCILDLTWYAPYKDLGDGIICAFMYACFMWHVFKNLYNIISGQNSVIDRAESYMTSTIPGIVKGE